jgi:tRNA pseudouridine(38-40) synthase
MGANLKITLQHDGTNYVGWQRQGAGVSIQGLLEDALAPMNGEPITVHGAGRTDAGVHALAQVATISFAGTLECPTLACALNAALPADVRVLSVEEAQPGFHARFSAIGKVRVSNRERPVRVAVPFTVRLAHRAAPGRGGDEACLRGRSLANTISQRFRADARSCVPRTVLCVASYGQTAAATIGP